MPRRRGYAGDMSNDARTPGSDDGRDPLEEMLRQLFGGQGPDPDEVRRAMEGLGGPGGVPFDPSQLNLPAGFEKYLKDR